MHQVCVFYMQFVQRPLVIITDQSLTPAILGMKEKRKRMALGNIYGTLKNADLYLGHPPLPQHTAEISRISVHQCKRRESGH